MCKQSLSVSTPLLSAGGDKGRREKGEGCRRNEGRRRQRRSDMRCKDEDLQVGCDIIIIRGMTKVCVSHRRAHECKM